MIVLKNAKKIFPEEIEVLLNNNPLVAESFVYGAERHDGDFEIRAKIVYNKEAVNLEYGEISEDKILEIMNEYRKKINKNLPLYKAIRKVFVTDIPLIKTTSGKIKRAEEKANN